MDNRSSVLLQGDQIGGYTGGGAVIRSMIGAMLKSSHYQKHFITSLLVTGGEKTHQAEFQSNIVCRRFPSRLIGTFLQKVWEKTLPKTDIIHGSFNILFNSRSRRKVLTLHDCAFMNKEYFPTKKQVAIRREVIRSIKNSDKIICVSKFTQNQLGRYFPTDLNKSVVIMNGVTHLGGILDGPQCFELNELHGPFILAVGTIEPRKNYPTIVSGFLLAKEMGYINKLTKLVIVGSMGWENKSVSDQISDLVSQKQVVWLQKIPGKTLKILYRDAIATIYLSEYEGFGLPPCECVMSGGLPVLGDAEVFREIWGQDMMYAKSKDPVSLAQTLNLANSITKEERFNKNRLWFSRINGMTWERYIEELGDVYRQLV